MAEEASAIYKDTCFLSLQGILYHFFVFTPKFMLVSLGAAETEQTVKTKEHGTGWDTAYGGACASVAVRILLRDIPQVSGIIAPSGLQKCCDVCGFYLFIVNFLRPNAKTSPLLRFSPREDLGKHRISFNFAGGNNYTVSQIQFNPWNGSLNSCRTPRA